MNTNFFFIVLLSTLFLFACKHSNHEHGEGHGHSHGETAQEGHKHGNDDGHQHGHSHGHANEHIGNAIKNHCQHYCNMLLEIESKSLRRTLVRSQLWVTIV